MQKDQAGKIVSEVLTSSFNKEGFSFFIKNLLNHVEDAPFVYRGNYIPDAYDQFISTLERIGKYSDGENNVDILIVNLKKETSIERARTMQRNFIAWYLNGSRGGNMKDAALVAFVSPSQEDWRFSLVKMDYKFEEGKNGKVKVKEEFTPARRWSFLVGKNENSHTAQSRLAPMLADDETNPTLKQIEDVFNIEKVTKEFFEKYRDLFLRVKEEIEEIVKKDRKLKNDFEDKNVDIVDFSKKFLGQIVFLYFLQKKGWFGVPMDKKWGDGDKKFLRSLFEKANDKSENYFNDYLEPLFYEALAKERDDDYYSRFKCKIPFLNGGLFDPINNYDWVNTVIDISNDLFSNTRKTKEGDIGDGILDIFDRYNFTVKEDEPLEKEVAVDPEMLGKVFENLLEVKDRKSKGTYYTPREIVHYMCQQSLINYLSTNHSNISKEKVEEYLYYADNINNLGKIKIKGESFTPGQYNELDELLKAIKVIDPACGSGAFLITMLQEIVKLRRFLQLYTPDNIKNGVLIEDSSFYELKRQAIENNIYGVDIDPGAVEIAKLRLWLSLIVDEGDIKDIKPLPNLDYKIMQGNSLLEEFDGIKLFDEKLISSVNMDNNDQLVNLKEKQSKLQSEYLKLHQENKLTPKRQVELTNELKRLSDQINKLNKPDKKNENAGLFDIYSKAKMKAEELKNLHKEFFETTEKKKKDRIKAEIEKLEWDLIETTLKEQHKLDAIKKLEELKKSNIKPFFLWRLNFAEVFENGGFDIVIANPPYINIEKLDESTKNYIFTKYKTCTGRADIYIAFIEKSFSIIKDNGFNSFIIPYSFTNQKYGTKLRELLISQYHVDEILDTSNYFVFDDVVVKNIVLFSSKRKLEKPTTIKIARSQIDFLKNKFDLHYISQQKFLEMKDSRFETKDISGLEDIKLKIWDDCLKFEDICFIAYGARLNHKSDNITKDNYISKERTDKFNKPYFEGKNIQRYKITQFGWLSYRPKEHYNSMFKELFENEKIVFINVVKDNLRFAIDNNGLYNSHTVVNCVKWNLLKDCDHISVKRNINDARIKNGERFDYRFLLGILNSNLIDWYFRMFLSEQLHFYPDDAKSIPIKNDSRSNQRDLTEIVDKILTITKSNDYLANTEKQTKVKEYEKQIDKMVYRLYGLSEKEIEVVDK